jgi:hypothetical protein
MSSTISDIDFRTEVMPYIHAINLQFISKRTNKPILTPNGASSVVRGFFANRNARASVLDTYTPTHRRLDVVHLLKTDKHPKVIRDTNILPDILNNKLKQLRLPWFYFQRNSYNAPTQEQIDRFNYIASGECNKDLKTLCANLSWNVNCFLMAELNYSPALDKYGYHSTHDILQSCVLIIGTNGTSFSRFMTPDNVVIEKIIL